jgi:hypothetical protein
MIHIDGLLLNVSHHVTFTQLAMLFNHSYVTVVWAHVITSFHGTCTKPPVDRYEVSYPSPICICCCTLKCATFRIVWQCVLTVWHVRIGLVSSHYTSFASILEFFVLWPFVGWSSFTKGFVAPYMTKEKPSIHWCCILQVLVKECHCCMGQLGWIHFLVSLNCTSLHACMHMHGCMHKHIRRLRNKIAEDSNQKNFSCVFT